MLKRVVVFIILALLVVWGGFGPLNKESEAATRVIVTDSTGAKVEIPVKINRIADAWGAHNEVVTALGAGDKIVATTLTAEVRPWLFKVNRHLNKAVNAFNIDATEINMEELLKVRPDIVFMNANEKTARKLADLKIPVVQLKISDFDSLKECVKLTGTALGGRAQQNAARYLSYLDNKIKLITERTAKLPAGERPRVLHLASLSPLAVDGKSTIIDDWINMAGGTDPVDFTGLSRQVSFEQVLKWNPDVIIIGRILSGSALNNSAQISATNLDNIYNDPKWQTINAVKKKKVYINPDGAFSWDRYSAEEALQIQWVAKLLHPDKFKDIDMVKETIFYFKTFMKYNLSKADAQRMLAGEPPLK